MIWVDYLSVSTARRQAEREKRLLLGEVGWAVWRTLLLSIPSVRAQRHGGIKLAWNALTVIVAAKIDIVLFLS